MAVRHCSVLFALILVGQPGAADELLMKNGSRLVGKLVSASQSDVVFDTPFAGQITIKQANINAIVTQEKVTLMMLDGSVYSDKLITTRDQELLVMDENQEPVIFDVADIKLVNPEPWRLGFGYKWLGQLNAALDSERGNTDTDELFMDLESVWRSLEDRFTLRGAWEVDEANGEKNKDNWTLRNKYDRFTINDPDNYYGAQVILEKDKFADLDLRTTVGPYIGRQFFESEPLTLHGEVGIVYVDENFEVAEDNHFWGANWEMRLSSDLIPHTQLYVHSDGVFNFEDMGGVLVNTTIGIGLPLMFGLQAAAEAIFEYDGGAVEDVDDTGESYHIKLGYNW